ncbi:MAG: thiamine pyrophosphate-dependent enzyme, partial [Holophagales bacterium]|nr:thiamine pyrophosphate-dependent enzyme [Holophagales bacterium]
YADPDPDHEPMSAGRQMNSHFATHTLDAEGNWLRLSELRTSSADSSPTGSQMPRLVGLGYASRLYRELPELRARDAFSRQGREVAFGTIGNASCAEGVFWESVNAMVVLGAPVLLSIWDDDYGISVPNRYQIAKENLSEVLAGFRRNRPGGAGCELYTVAGWDYPELCRVYTEAARRAREEHVPVIVHVRELTQPQGHSTSGSHERYKSEERLRWERENDCLARMRAWILEQDFATEAELVEIDREAVERVREAQRSAWSGLAEPIRRELDEVAHLIERTAETSPRGDELRARLDELRRIPSPLRRHLMASAREAILLLHDSPSAERDHLVAWHRQKDEENRGRYGRHLYSETADSALEVPEIPAEYDDAPAKNGFEILNQAFDAALARHPELIAFGEDLGQLGDVNQGFSGLQERYGVARVSDTGIRECTILGQAIGMAMRGLRPLAEIQYLDYLPYALQIISDDLATLRYRTAGRQKAPVIVRTRGHRLEGIWHSGSPMAGILGLVRGVYVCVPRDMTRAAGMYNTLLRSDDSAIVVEVLNGYRIKETLPRNLGEMTVPLGIPEVLREGTSLTVVTYGACCRVVLAAAEKLARLGIELEVIDVQTLLPFDRPHRILESVKKTSRLLFVDEDVPGGATAYMMQKVVEEQGAFQWLDAPPVTLPATEHRPAYGSDGDYWSKPNSETVFEAAYRIVHEAEPERFPLFFA